MTRLPKLPELLLWLIAWAILAGVACGAPSVCRMSNASGDHISYGSGTLIDVDPSTGKGLVLTCAHLFREGSGSLGCCFSGTCFPGKVVAIEYPWDLAVVEISASPEHSRNMQPVEVAAYHPQVDDPITACGFGQTGEYQCQRGRVIGYGHTDVTSENETLRVSGIARDGDSGGPIFNDRGELVAVLWGTNGRMVAGTYCGRIRKFLAEHSPRLAARWQQRRQGQRLPDAPLVPMRPGPPVGTFETPPSPPVPPLPVQPQSPLPVAEVVSVRRTRQSGYSGVLGELEDRMPAQHIYRDAHPGTWAHETTHGLNGRIRNSCGGTGRMNAAFVHGGYALVLPEPPVTLTEVAHATPQEWRGGSYGLYMVQQAREWNDEPLYILDELSAYINGAVACIQTGRTDSLASDLTHAEEMRRYAVVLWHLAKARGYPHSQELGNFIAACRVYIEQLGANQ